MHARQTEPWTAVLVCSEAFRLRHWSMQLTHSVCTLKMKKNKRNR